MGITALPAWEQMLRRRRRRNWGAGGGPGSVLVRGGMVRRVAAMGRLRRVGGGKRGRTLAAPNGFRQEVTRQGKAAEIMLKHIVRSGYPVRT